MDPHTPQSEPTQATTDQQIINTAAQNVVNTTATNAVQPAVSIAPTKSSKLSKIIAITMGVVVLLLAAGILIAKPNSASDAMIKTGSNSKLVGLTNRYDNQCYSFDSTGLKSNNQRGVAKYACEVSMNIDNDGFYPVADILMYSDTNFDPDVATNKKAIEASGYTVTSEVKTVGGARAILLIGTKPLSSNTLSIDTSTGEKQTESKNYILIVDAAGKMSSSAGKKITGVTLRGSYNSQKNIDLVDQIISTWLWK
jgi:hypothetical protein